MGKLIKRLDRVLKNFQKNQSKNDKWIRHPNVFDTSSYSPVLRNLKKNPLNYDFASWLINQLVRAVIS